MANQSARLLCGYIYADAGMGESTQDLVFAGHDLICENGAVLAESKRFETGLTLAELDLGRLAHDRRRMNTFVPSAQPMTEISFDLPLRDTRLTRVFPQTPFVPSDKDDLQARCEEILNLQATGLATRLRHTRAKSAVIGLSGGLDSTLALIVTVHAFDRLGWERDGIHAVTMPCFGTTRRTKSNAEKLAEAYGARLDCVAELYREMARNLKEFLRLRDSHPAFDRVKMLGNIGIPCFLYSDGSVNFSLASSRRIAATHSSSAANADANADGATCSIDGKGC